MCYLIEYDTVSNGLSYHRTDQRLGEPWGPVGVEDWPASQCIPSVSPVACGGVIEGGEKQPYANGSVDNEHLILVTFINRTVSLLVLREDFTVLKHLGLFRNFLNCYDTNRYILLAILILLLVTVVLTILYLLYRIISRHNLKGVGMIFGDTSSTAMTGSSAAGSSTASSFTSSSPTSAVSSYYRNRQQPPSKALTPKSTVKGGDVSSSFYRVVLSSTASFRAANSAPPLPVTKTSSKR